MWLRLGGLGAGAAAAALLLAGWAVPGGSRVPPAHLTLSVEPSAQVALAPMGENVAQATVSAGEGRLARTIALRNASGAPLRIRFRLASQEGQLDGALAVRLASGGRVVYEGPLSGPAASAPVELAPRVAEKAGA
jgi:hypothetical protein